VAIFNFTLKLNTFLRKILYKLIITQQKSSLGCQQQTISWPSVSIEIRSI